MDNLTLGVIGAVIVIGLLTIFKFSGKKEKEENKDEIRLYYRYAGDIEWIRYEIERYRFGSLKYLFSCKNKEESDFQIIINNTETDISADFYATEFNYSKKYSLECIVKDLKLTDEKYDELMENLKDTYIEDNHDGKAIEKIKKNTEEEVKEII